MLVPPPSITDPDGFHLAIIAAVARLYLGLSGDGVYREGDRPNNPSDLWVAFESRGLGLPDFAMFWDYARCPYKRVATIGRGLRV